MRTCGENQLPSAQDTYAQAGEKRWNQGTHEEVYFTEGSGDGSV